MNRKLSTKQIMISILSIKEQLYKLYKNDEQYSILLEFLMSEDFYDDDEIPIPTIKTITEQTGITGYQVNKKLSALYDTFFADYSKPLLEFNEVEIEYSARNYFDSMFIRVKSVGVIPRVGENISMPLLSAKMHTNMFYVESVDHTFEGKKQIIHIGLVGGYFNPYWHIRKSEVELKNEIPMRERWEMTDYDMKKRLGYY